MTKVKGSNAVPTHRPGGEREFNPLLDSFADRYVHALERPGRERIGSPLDLRPQLEEAHELFERGRQGWRTFGVLAKGKRPRVSVLRDFEGKEWSAQRIEVAQKAHRFLLAHPRFDLSKPDELPLVELHARLSEQVPFDVLYMSVAMRCAVDAAEECFRLAHLVEGVPLLVRQADLDVQREINEIVADARERAATRLGSARTALALWSAAWAWANLDQADRDYMKLWQRLERVIPKANLLTGTSGRRRKSKYGLKPSPSLAQLILAITKGIAEEARLKKESIERRAKAREVQRLGAQASALLGQVNRKEVEKRFKEIRQGNNYTSDHGICVRIGKELKLSVTTVRDHADACGLLHQRKLQKNVSEVSGLREQSERESSNFK